MKKKILHQTITYLLILSVITGCDFFNNQKLKLPIKLTASEIYNKNINSVVTIITNNKSQGSGFFIDDEILVTNYHVIEGASSAEAILNHSNKRYEVTGYLGVDKINDLILLKVKSNYKNKIDFSLKSPLPGDKVFVIGSPLGFSKTITEGLISGKRNFEGIKLLQISAPISSGSSGGPVFNEYGKLVGVAVSKLKNADNIGFCIPTSSVNSLLNFRETYPVDIAELIEHPREENTIYDNSYKVEGSSYKTYTYPSSGIKFNYLYKTELLTKEHGSVALKDENDNIIYEVSIWDDIFVINSENSGRAGRAKVFVSGHFGTILKMHLKRKK